MDATLSFEALEGHVDTTRLSQIKKDATELCNNALANSTKTKYASTLRAEAIPENLWPIDTIEKVMVIFTPLRYQAFHKVTSLKCAVAAYHKTMGWLPPPFENPRLSHFWEGLQKSCNNVVQGASALRKPQLTTMINFWVARNTLASRRNAAVATLQFYSMSRIGEILQLTAADLIERGAGFDVHIRSAKNDRFGKGQVKVLPAKSNDGVEITHILKNFLSDAKLLTSGHIVRSSRGTGSEVWQPTCPMMKTASWNQTLRETMNHLDIREEGQRITSHSLRKGGFTRSHEVGMQLQDAIQVLGHRSASAWPTYSQQHPDRYRSALEKM